MIKNLLADENSRVLDPQSKTHAAGTPGVPPGEAGAARRAGARRGQGPGDRPSQVTLAVVLQVRENRLQVLLWERAKPPFAGAWSLPGGYLEPGQTLEQSIRRHLATKVDVGELSWLEQPETRH